MLGVTTIRRKRLFAISRIAPAGGDSDQFLVESGRACAIKRQATKQHYARNRVVGLGEASAGEVVVNKSLGKKSPEQSLHDAVREMELHRVSV
jgi:hypothetical protein